MLKQLIKPLIIIASIIIFCTLLAKVVLSGETLEEYALRNPDIAYPSPEPVLDVIDAEDEEAAEELLADDEVNDENFGEGDEKSEGDLFVSKWSVAEYMMEYQPGFSKEPIGDQLLDHIRGVSYPVTMDEAIEAVYGFDNGEGKIDLDELYSLIPNIVEDASKIVISLDDLVFLSILYHDYDGVVQVGEMICNIAIADDLLYIFHELYLAEYQLEKVSLIEVYGGSDTFSMLYNNSSCFNYRESSPGTWSNHAYGLAVDISPFVNPYVAYNQDGTIRKISPIGSEEYADRSRDFPHKIDEGDLLLELFRERGFFWGGDWKYQKDYHHFQKVD